MKINRCDFRYYFLIILFLFCIALVEIRAYTFTNRTDYIELNATEGYLGLSGMINNLSDKVNKEK